MAAGRVHYRGKGATAAAATYRDIANTLALMMSVGAADIVTTDRDGGRVPDYTATAVER